MPERAIRLLIVDDHPVVRDGLRGMFAGEPEFEVVADAENGRDGVSKAKAFDPDVVLMDLRMPGMDGVSAIQALTESGLRAKALVLTTYDTDRDVLPAIEAGAIGFLLKDTPRDELFKAVRAAARGETVLSPGVGAMLLGQVRQTGKEIVTDRELEVLRLVAGGSSNREIAKQLFISEATVKSHLLHLYEKLGVNDRAGAVGAAFERGLLTRGQGSRSF
jgi:DNA-binding NarL/FixJ family response regulator